MDGLYRGDDIRVGRLRLRGAGTDPQQTRLRLARLLASTDLRPPGVPPAAVLIVRRLDDPLPGAVLPRDGGPLVTPAWEQAARVALDRIYRRAARPALGTLPDTAEAVLFRDLAELLACLALDLGRGLVGHRWWWQGPLPQLPPAARITLPAALGSLPHYTPAALACLAHWGTLPTVLARLTPEAALAVLSAVGQVFDLGGVSTVLTGLPTADRAAAHQPQPSNSTPTEALAWRERRSPPGSGALGREQTALLLVGLELAQRPATVRDPLFLRELARWWAAEATIAAPPIRLSADAAIATATSQPHPPTLADHDEQPTPAARLRATTPWSSDPAHMPPTEALAAPAQPAAPATPDRPPPQVRQTEPTTPTHQAATTHPVPYAVSEQPGASVLPPEDAPIPAPTMQPARPAVIPTSLSEPGPSAAATAMIVPTSPAWQVLEGMPALPVLPGEGVTTALGGVLFLINLMIHLNLPEGFDPDWALSARLGAWPTLEALGRGLLDKSARRWADDPLWQALALLDGRAPASLPGRALEQATRWAAPPAWPGRLGDGPNDAYLWACDTERLWLWSRRGYLLLEEPLRSDPHTQARAALHSLLGSEPPILTRAEVHAAPLAALSGPLTAGLATSLRNWLRCTLPAVQLRLCRALGLANADTLEQALLLRPAQLYVGPTHVDLVMALDTVELPVRLAGLDRNPGWIADYGRVVLFHFV